jgi:hypothetical protein
VRVRTAAPEEPPLVPPLPAAPLVRVRTASAPPEDGAVAFAPLVCVRTGAAPLARELPVLPLPVDPLVRVRGAEELPLDAGATPVPREPLAAVRGAPAAVARTLELLPAARLAPAERRLCSWRTTWTVRLMTCVRTSVAGCSARATRVGVEPARSV